MFRQDLVLYGNSPSQQIPPFMSVCYLESSQIQFTSQVFPPSGENDCSMRAELGEMLSQT